MSKYFKSELTKKFSKVLGVGVLKIKVDSTLSKPINHLQLINEVLNLSYSDCMALIRVGQEGRDFSFEFNLLQGYKNSYGHVLSKSIKSEYSIPVLWESTEPEDEVREQSKLFSIQKGLGVNLTQVLLGLNKIVYNSNLKIKKVPGQSGFNQELYDSTKGTKLDLWAKCLKTASRRFDFDSVECLGLAVKLKSGVANDHIIGGISSSFLVSSLGSEGNLPEVVMKMPQFKFNDPIPYKTSELIEGLYKIRNKTIDSYVSLVLNLNNVDDENSIVTTGGYSMTTSMISNKELKEIINLEEKLESPIEKLEKSVEYSEVDNLDPRSGAFSMRSNSELSHMNNPFLLSKILSYSLNIGDIDKKELVNIVEFVRSNNEYFQIEKFEEIFFENLYVVISLKEYLRLLK